MLLLLFCGLLGTVRVLVRCQAANILSNVLLCSVRSASGQGVVSSEAYVLFYELIE